MSLIRRAAGRRAAVPLDIEVARNLPAPAWEFRGETGEARDAGAYGWVWDFWSVPSEDRVAARMRAQPNGDWSVWIGYPGREETWRLLVFGRALSQAAATKWINRIVHGDLIVPGGAHPTLPRLTAPTESYEARWARQNREAAASRRRDERNRRQSLRDTPHGHYPELLTEWPMSASGREGTPWRTLSHDGTIEHRVEEFPSWGQRHHLRYFLDGEPVAGLTLKAKRPWRGLQSAEIMAVFTAEGYRREGYARALLGEARSHFRVVRHSKDLTGAGAAWKRGVRSRIRAEVP